jgi:FtsP/CotA-like multicopper oxidase with cupredoxin domain
MAYQQQPFNFDFRKTGVQGLVNYDTFGCNVFGEDPPTPDWLEPDIVFNRGTHSDARIRAPDGREIRFWGFIDPDSPDPVQRTAPYPSPLIRVRQGQIVHVHLESEHGPHTIHFHAIEPTTMNDGVGHVSFEVNDAYTYQWQANEIGTYFYHCHRNTVLHFEMGMIGPLIVDPPQGPGWVSATGPTYQVERIWFCDDVDPRWHNLNNGDHDVGLCGEDAGLNRWEPKYFLINGVFSNNTLNDPKVSPTVKLGQRLLIRIINAGYSVMRITMGTNVVLVGVDGRVLGKHPWNTTVPIPANSTQVLTTAGRFDYLVTPTRRGNIPCKIEFIDWVSGLVHPGGVVNTQIKVV